MTCLKMLQYNVLIYLALFFFKAISSSVTRLSKPESDDADNHRNHLPVPKLEHFVYTGDTQREEQKDDKSIQNNDWKTVVNERLKKKTRRFNSVSELIIYFFH